MWVFLILIAIPAIEIGLFIEVGGEIGVWPTIAIIFMTALLGAILMRAQGFSALNRLQRALAEEKDPRGPLADGVMILLAGVLMLIPGFFTDALGFLLLLPPVRAALFRFIGPALKARAGRGGASFSYYSGGAVRPARDEAIETEYKDLTGDKAPPSGKPSGWTQPPD